MRKILCLALSLLFYSNTLYAARDFIIDTDPGVDDIIAILYFLKQPNVNVKAITTEGSGNASAKAAFKTASNLLKTIHREDIPVGYGDTMPVYGHAFPKKLKTLQETFANDFLDQANAKPKYSSVYLLTNLLRTSPEPISILTLGPYTNIAKVIVEHPELIPKIKMIYSMGGAVRVPGNISAAGEPSENTTAEWNIYFDPGAAKVVFESGIPITLIPLDVTNQAMVDKRFQQEIKKAPQTVEVKIIEKILTKLEGLTWYFWDPMAAVVATDESMMKIEELPLSVLIKPENQSGATIIDEKQGKKIRVCTRIDSEIFKKIFLERLQG